MADQTADERALRDAMRELAQTRHDLNGCVEALAQTRIIEALEELPTDEREKAIALFIQKAHYLRRAVTSLVRTTARNMGLPTLQRYAPKDPDKPAS